MKIVYNGELEKRPSGGCNCKKRGNSEYRFTTRKMYILPSGITKTFYKDKVETVSDTDGEFLLSYSGLDVNGSHRELFTKVE